MSVMTDAVYLRRLQQECLLSPSYNMYVINYFIWVLSFSRNFTAVPECFQGQAPSLLDLKEMFLYVVCSKCICKCSRKNHDKV